MGNRQEKIREGLYIEEYKSRGRVNGLEFEYFIRGGGGTKFEMNLEGKD